MFHNIKAQFYKVQLMISKLMVKFTIACIIINIATISFFDIISVYLYNFSQVSNKQYCESISKFISNFYYQELQF